MKYGEACKYLRNTMKLPMSTGFQELIVDSAVKIQELELQIAELKKAKLISQGEKTNGKTRKPRKTNRNTRTGSK